MNIALQSNHETKRAARKAGRIRPFYYASGRTIYQRDASTDHLPVKITDTDSETIADAISHQLNRSEIWLSLIRSFVDALTRAFGDPSRRFIHPKVALSWRSAREEIASLERDAA